LPAVLLGYLSIARLIYFCMSFFVTTCEYGYSRSHPVFALTTVCIYMYGVFTVFLSFSNFDTVRWMSPVFYVHLPVKLVSETFYKFAILRSPLFSCL